MTEERLKSTQALFLFKAKGIREYIHGLKISHVRTAVQASFTLFCLYAGYRFYCFYLWIQNQSETFTNRPPSVEAFLPISALLGLKRFILTGQWDPIHPAGLTIFLAALTV